MKTHLFPTLAMLLLASCADFTDGAADDVADPIDECVFCDAKADAFGIARDSYLAYGIVNVANTATFDELDNVVPLDVRAARGIVAGRPFEFIEQVDTVSYVGTRAFTNLAKYAEANGFVPYCGDSELQSILEACDDGNGVDGDGCSATCQIEEGSGSSFLAEQPELIRGGDIGVSLVDPNAYYLRERPFTGYGLDADVEAILERADGIVANTTANDRVSFDELVIMSTEPFYSSLFQDEKLALEAAWEIFEVSDQPVQVIEYAGGDISPTAAFAPTIERVGPLMVDPVRRIASLDGATLREVCRRLQQMPGSNADGDPETIDIADVDKAIADYGQVFTEDEMWELEQLRALFIAEAEPEFGGDFAIAFAAKPNQGSVNTVLADFDGFTFRLHVDQEVHYDAYDPDDNYQPYNVFDANLRSELSVRTSLAVDGDLDGVCSRYSSCPPFRHREVNFMHLDGTSAVAGRERGIMLMEHFENGERVYNRIVEFKNTYREIEQMRTYHNEYAFARPSLADGTPLSLRKDTMVSYGQKRYQRFKLAEVQTVFNRNAEKFFPNSYDELESLRVGRHEAVAGVVIEVHESRAVIAYFDGCEVPLTMQDGELEGECRGSGRRVEISFDTTRAFLRVFNGNLQEEAQLYNVLNPYLAIDLDRTYYVIK